MLGTILADYVRFVRFMSLKGDVRMHRNIYLLVGFAITWIVGFGRTWDFPDAPFWIRTGLTSIVYALALAGFIWLIGLALKPARWSYLNVLLMVLMTALPGIIYAIPVERFMVPDAARTVNMIFLLIVATWRMLLYRRFLDDVAQLPKNEARVAWLLPPTLIVAALGAVGSLNAIARNMGGVRDPLGEIIDGTILWITLAAWLALPLLLIAFVAMAFARSGVTRSDRLD